MSQPSQALVPLDTARKFLMSPAVKSRISEGIAKHITADRMASLALTACQKTPKLMECFASIPGQQSIGLSLLRAGQRGVEVDGRQAHLVPFRDNKLNATLCVLIIGYQGLIDLALNHPKVKAIDAKVAYTNEVFEVDFGTQDRITHRPNLTGDRGDLLAAYAIATLEGGHKVFVVLSIEDIEKIRAASRGSESADSPWNTWPEEMWKKSAVKRLSKIIPQSDKLRSALNDEDDFEQNGPRNVIDITAEPEVKFTKQVSRAVSSAKAETLPAQSAPEPPSAPNSNDAPPSGAPPTDEAEPEPPMHVKLSRFFEAEAKGSQFSDVLAALVKLNCTWAKDSKATDYIGLTEKHQSFIWSGRRGLVAEVAKLVAARNAPAAAAA